MLFRLLLGACSLWASSAPGAEIDLAQSLGSRIDLAPFWTVQPASAGRALLPDFANRFVPITEASKQPWAADNGYWFKLELGNSGASPITRLLVLDDPLISVADLIVVEQAGGVSRQRAGLLVPGSEKRIRMPQPAFTLTVPAEKRTIAYLMVYTRNGIGFDAALWTPEALYHHQDAHTWFFGIALGVILVMAIYNLLVASLTSDPLFRGLGLLLAGVAATHLIVQGWGSTYLWSESPAITGLLIGPVISLTLVALLSFGRQFLVIGAGTPLGRALDLTQAFNVAMACVLIIKPDGGLFTVLLAGNFPALLVLTGQAIKLAWTRQSVGIHFLGALAPLFIGLGALIGNRVLEFGYSVTTSQGMILVANAMVATSFAVMLADRIRRISQSRQRAYQDLLLAKQHVRESESRAVAASRENKAKSAFLATMSHEIRTPMNGVLGMAELLTQSDLTPQQQYYVTTLKRSGRALLDILNEVLDYSKVEAGRLELESIEVDLLELLDDSVMLFEDALMQNNLRCHILLQPDVPRLIKVDPTRIKQVLGNLLSNAIKFTNGGEIRVRISRLGEKLSFSVADEGTGIPPTALPRLFDRFEQADSSISRKHGGTGLGLAISKRLVELMGGSIGARNNPEGGATFTFTIDYQAAPCPATTPTHKRYWLLTCDDTLARSIALLAQRWGADLRRLQSPDDSQLAALTANDCLLVGDGFAPATRARIVDLDKDAPTLCLVSQVLGASVQSPMVTAPRERNPLAELDVLVAEDNATNRLVLGKMLDDWGARVRFAQDGEEARDLYNSNHDAIDLVLMDCEMPKIDGYAAAEAIRRMEAERTWQQVPIIAITAHIMPEFRRRAESVGMSDYVTKPLDRDTLLGAIMNATQRHRRSDHH